jgi:peptide/nickel transport system ATP-binding protein
MDRAQTREYRREVQPIFQDPFEVYSPFYRVDHVLTTPLRNFGLASGRRTRRRRMEEAMEMVGLRPKEAAALSPMSSPAASASASMSRAPWC